MLLCVTIEIAIDIARCRRIGVQCTPLKVRVKVKVDVGWALQRRRRRWAGGAGRRAAPGARGRGAPVQIHFRPAAAARHASERKLAAASERLSRAARSGAPRTIRATPAPALPPLHFPCTLNRMRWNVNAITKISAFYVCLTTMCGRLITDFWTVFF